MVLSTFMAISEAFVLFQIGLLNSWWTEINFTYEFEIIRNKRDGRDFNEPSLRPLSHFKYKIISKWNYYWLRNAPYSNVSYNNL